MLPFLFVLYNPKILESQGNLETLWCNCPSSSITKKKCLKMGGCLWKWSKEAMRAYGMLLRATTANGTDSSQELKIVGFPSQVVGGFPGLFWTSTKGSYKAPSPAGQIPLWEGSSAFLGILTNLWAMSFCLLQVFERAGGKIRTMKMLTLFCSLFLTIYIQFLFFHMSH